MRKLLPPVCLKISSYIFLQFCTQWGDAIDGFLVIKLKRFFVMTVDLEIERIIVAFAIDGRGLKKFALIFAIIVGLEIGTTIVANVIAGWEV